ncbi:MAG: T9SS type A sorting domain-containing protein, partial [Crocinitomicaceae bacterium]
PNDTAKVIVAVQTCNYLGLDETALDGFKMYPNPTDGLVYIAYEGVANVFNYEVTDLNGRKVAEKQNAINGTSVTEIDLNNVENGIYMIRVFNTNAQKTFRVIVK